MENVAHEVIMPFDFPPILIIKIGKKKIVELINPKKKRPCKKTAKMLVLTRVLKLFNYDKIGGQYIPHLTISHNGKSLTFKIPAKKGMTEKEYMKKHRQTLKQMIQNQYEFIFSAKS